MTTELFLNACEYAQVRGLARSLAHVRGRGRLAADLRDDLGTLGLVLLGLIGSLVEKGVVTREEILAHLRRVDEIDGAADGKVTPDQVRDALGLAAKPSRPATGVRRKRR
ncbi:MAG TPA: hypothetical protein VFY93_16175 [Planctomycetota bacterium]|nr:hypothetical protein [Planctomycetota bacterium]